MREKLKKHPRAAGVCALALVLIAAALWYTRPVSFAELVPGLDRAAVTELSVHAVPDGGEGPLVSLTLSGDDPLIGELFRLLDSYTFRRSLFGLLPRPSAAPVRDKGWDIRLDFADGSSLGLDRMSRGMYLSFRDGVSYPGWELCVSAAGHRRFDAEMHALLTESALYQ